MPYQLVWMENGEKLTMRWPPLPRNATASTSKPANPVSRMTSVRIDSSRFRLGCPSRPPPMEMEQNAKIAEANISTDHNAEDHPSALEPGDSSLTIRMP